METKIKASSHKKNKGFIQHYFLRSKNSAGFTLIELLVVIAIIGLLASVVLIALNSARQKARDAKRVADLNQLLKAFELYFGDNNSYPTVTSAGVLSNIGSPPLVPNYVSTLPVAPLPADGSCSSATNGGNAYYMYANSTGVSQAQTSVYTLTFCLGSQVGALGPGPHTLSQGGMQ